MTAKKRANKPTSKPRPKDLPLSTAKSERVKGGSLLSSIGKVVSPPIKTI